MYLFIFFIHLLIYLPLPFNQTKNIQKMLGRGARYFSLLIQGESLYVYIFIYSYIC